MGARLATRAEFLYAHADDDPSMDAAGIARLGAALESAGATFTSEVYAGARHGFTMADTNAYDTAAYARHERELRELLGRTFSNFSK